MSTLSTEAITTAGTVFADRWDGPGRWWPVFPFLWLLVAAAVVTVFVLRGRRHRRRAGPEAGRTRLAERFAAGEIDETEYRARLGVLAERRT